MKGAQELAEELVATWQKVLRLQDWTVEVSVVPMSAMPTFTHHAETRMSLTLKRATMKVLRPEDAELVAPSKYDMEATIVHELLHLHWEILLRDLEENSTERFLAEQAIDLCAEGYVGLKRFGGSEE